MDGPVEKNQEFYIKSGAVISFLVVLARSLSPSKYNVKFSSERKSMGQGK
jgi:hypothetical protein